MADFGIGETLLASEIAGEAGLATLGPSVLGAEAAFGTPAVAGFTGALAPEVGTLMQAAGSALTPEMLSAGMSPYMSGVVPGAGVTTDAAGNVVESAIGSAAPTPAAAPYVPQAPSTGIDSIGKLLKNILPKDKQNNIDWLKTAGYGLGGLGAYNLLTGKGNNYLKPYQPPTAASYGLGRTLSAGYQPIRPYASGGIADLKIGPSSVASSGVAPAGLLAAAPEQGITMQDVQDLAGKYGYQLPPGMADGGIAGLSANPNFPMSQQQAPRYAVSSQMPVGASDVRMASLPPTPMARGGVADLGGYSDGGRMLKGPGDGMSDSIPASIGGKQPARLADGEFVVPADVVSHLGNGSTDAGAKQLYKMMDKVRTARTGRKAQGRQINPKKYVPA